MSLSAKPPESNLVLASSTLVLRSTTNRVAIVLSLSVSLSPSPWPARLPPRSLPTSRCAAARTPLHSPTAGVVRRPASGLPLPPLSSSPSSHHARRAATHIVVSPCPVQTAPRYSARSPPAACAPSYLRLCCFLIAAGSLPSLPASAPILDTAPHPDSSRIVADSPRSIRRPA